MMKPGTYCTGRTAHSDDWQIAKRVPAAVRFIGERAGHGVEVEWNPVARTATMREPWRWT
jgi:hypothetical protein